MKTFNFIVDGEFTNELLTLTYDSKVIYKGYTDDLVTSVTGDLEMNLNFGMNETYSVIARKYENYLVWIPKLPLDQTTRYEPIIFTLQQFKELWRFLKYNPQDDLERLKNLNDVELKLIWMVLSRGTERIENITSLSKSVKNNIIALSPNLEKQQTTLYNLIDHEDAFHQREIIESESNWDAYIAYLDQGEIDEWVALKRDNKGKLYMHLGNDLCLAITFHK